MGWLDALERRAREAVGSVPAAPVRKPVVQRKPRIELKHVIIQTSYAHPDKGDPGAVAVGYYSVSDEDGVRVLTMRDETGKSLGKGQALGPNDDPHMIAGRMVRAKWLQTTGEGNFNRRLNYRPLGIA